MLRNKLTADDVEKAGYTICKDGKILGKNGKALNPGLSHRYHIVVISIAGVRYTLRVHRLVALKYLGLKRAQVVDHINHNCLDNRLSNLRVCSSRQNNQHQAIKSGHSSRFKGVGYRKDRGYWRAYIRINGRNTFLGHFHDELQAAQAYNEAAIKYFGEFALLNKL